MAENISIFTECVDYISEYFRFSRNRICEGISEIYISGKNIDKSTSDKWFRNFTIPKQDNRIFICKYFQKLFNNLNEEIYLQIKKDLLQKVIDYGINIGYISTNDREIFVEEFFTKLFREITLIKKIGLIKYREEFSQSSSAEGEKDKQNKTINEVSIYFNEISKKIITGKHTLNSLCSSNNYIAFEHFAKITAQSVCDLFSEIMTDLLGATVNVAIKLFIYDNEQKQNILDWNILTYCRNIKSLHRSNNIYKVKDFMELFYLVSEKSPLFLASGLDANFKIYINNKEYEYFSPVKNWKDRYTTKIVAPIILDLNNNRLQNYNTFGFISLDTHLKINHNDYEKIDKIKENIDYYSSLLYDYFHAYKLLSNKIKESDRTNST